MSLPLNQCHCEPEGRSSLLVVVSLRGAFLSFATKQSPPNWEIVSRRFAVIYKLDGVERMITFTFAGDEAGDASFNFGKGASRYFVVAVVATQDADRLRSTLTQLREREHFAESFEFHFNALASEKLREKTLTALREADFMAWAMIVDKTVVPLPLRALSGMEFYLYFVTELIDRIPVEIRNKGTLILDEFGSAHAALVKLKRMLKVRGIRHEFSRIFFRRSRSEDLIQVADLVAGAILRRDAKKDSQAFEYIEEKLQAIFEYRG
jgi:hypothetical protein